MKSVGWYKTGEGCFHPESHPFFFGHLMLFSFFILPGPRTRIVSAISSPPSGCIVPRKTRNNRRRRRWRCRGFFLAFTPYLVATSPLVHVQPPVFRSGWTVLNSRNLATIQRQFLRNHRPCSIHIRTPLLLFGYPSLFTSLSIFSLNFWLLKLLLVRIRFFRGGEYECLLWWFFFFCFFSFIQCASLRWRCRFTL